MNILLCTISFRSQNWIPFPVGCLISHCKKDDYINNNYNFLDPEFRSDCLEHKDFKKTLDKVDILGLTNYVWNQSYNDKISIEFKKRNPKGIVVYGGPSVPENEQIAEEYLFDRFYVDICFPGPGEEIFKNFLKNYKNNGINDVQGAFTHDYNNVKINRRLYSKIDLPTPYKDGIFNHIFKSYNNLIASFETNRGCPYSCAFCDWGGVARSKIHEFEEDKVKDNLECIFKEESIDRVELVDANFGMMKRDEELLDHLITINDDRNKPMKMTFAGFAKNGSKSLFNIIKKIDKNFVSQHKSTTAKISFQSHHPEVLKINQRDNIKNEKLDPMIKYYKDNNIKVHAEMMLLPGENTERFMHSLQKSLDLNINQHRLYLTWVVPNTPLYSEEFRRKNKIKLKKILIPHDIYHSNTTDVHNHRKGKPFVTKCNFDDPTDYQTIETFYECSSFDQHELSKIFDMWFWFSTFYNSNIIRDNMKYDKRKMSEQYNDFLDNLYRMPFIKTLLDEYRDCAYNTVVKPESVTKITDVRYAAWLNKYLFRMGELWEIYNNLEQVSDELSYVYDNIDFNRLKPIENMNTLYYNYTRFEYDSLEQRKTFHTYT